MPDDIKKSILGQPPDSAALNAGKPADPAASASTPSGFANSNAATTTSASAAPVSANSTSKSSNPAIPASSGAKPEAPKEGNVFTRLFGATTLEKSILSAPPPSSAAQPSLASLLGPRPIFSPAALDESEKKATKVAKIVFQFAIAAALGVYGFFYTQLNSNFTLLSDQFGQNSAIRFESSLSQVKKNQTDLNLVRFRTERLLLEEINSVIDSYQKEEAILNSDFSTTLQKQDAAAKMETSAATIKQLLKAAQSIFAQQLGVDTFSRQVVSAQERETAYEQLLREELNRQKQALASNEEARVINNILRLVENKSFKQMIASKDLEKISDADFSSLLKEIRKEGTDELSLIEKIKAGRLDWGTVIKDIHDVTRKADFYFGEGLFKSVGGFLYSSYRFDAKTGRVSITGITKTLDSKTFSAIAGLIDSIEKSPKFKDIDFRSFAKSKEEDGQFSSSLNLEFAMQAKDEKDARDDLPAQPTQ